MAHFILTARRDVQACVIQRFPEGMRSIYKPTEGVRMGESYPEAREFHMSSRMGGKRVTDVIRNLLGYLIVSDAVRGVLEQHSDAEIEWLPIHLVDHKSRRVPRSFFIANVIGTIDCVDAGRSVYTESAMAPGQFLYLKKLVLDDSRVDPARKIFRTASMPKLILVRDDLAAMLRDSGATGLDLLPVGAEVDL